MTSAGISGFCAVCKGGNREIVQSQSLSLLNRDVPCEIHFCVCAIAAICSNGRRSVPR